MPKKRSVQEIMRDAKHLKTQSRYDKAWDSFMAYHNHPDIKEVDEEKFIQYFDMLINEKKFCVQPYGLIFLCWFPKASHIVVQNWMITIDS